MSLRIKALPARVFGGISHLKTELEIRLSCLAPGYPWVTKGP